MGYLSWDVSSIVQYLVPGERVEITVNMTCTLLVPGQHTIWPYDILRGRPSISQYAY
jgi:hypothetical protein